MGTYSIQFGSMVATTPPLPQPILARALPKLRDSPRDSAYVRVAPVTPSTRAVRPSAEWLPHRKSERWWSAEGRSGRSQPTMLADDL